MKSYFFVLSLLALFAACQPRSGNEPRPVAEEIPGANSDSMLAVLNKRIAEEPNNYVHYLDRARYYGSKEFYDLAFKDIERALAIDSTRGDVYLYRGELHWFRQDVNAAYEDYKECLTHDATNTGCLLKKAAIDIVLENYPLALEHINTALRQNDQLAEAYYLKGRLYKQSGDTTLSASSYQTAIEVDPKYYEAYIEVGLLYAARKHDLAKEYYNSAIQLRPRSIEAWYNKAMFLQETGRKQPQRYQEAFVCYDSILSIDSTWYGAHFNKGFIYLEYLQDYENGAVEFTRATRLFPEYAQAYYNRGLCMESLGKTKDAENDYRLALRYEPQFTDAAQALSRVLGE